MCPRLGDAYARSEAVLDLRVDVVYSRLREVGPIAILAIGKRDHPELVGLRGK